MTSRIATVESKKELAVLSVKKRTEMFKKTDIDNDGKIDYEEFIKSIENIKEDIYVEKEFKKFRKIFCKADKDNHGLITADQFRLLLGSVHKEIFTY